MTQEKFDEFMMEECEICHQKRGNCTLGTSSGLQKHYEKFGDAVWLLPDGARTHSIPTWISLKLVIKATLPNGTEVTRFEEKS